MVDQQPASGLLDLGILALSSAIQPLAMLEPKYSMVPRLLCSLRALRASPDRSPCSNDPAKLRIVMMLDQNSSAACMERHPVAFAVPIERRPKKTWGLLRQIQPRMALSKPMRCPCPQRPKILKWTAVKRYTAACKHPWSSAPFASPIAGSSSTSTSTSTSAGADGNAGEQ